MIKEVLEDGGSGYYNKDHRFDLFIIQQDEWKSNSNTSVLCDGAKPNDANNNDSNLYILVDMSQNFKCDTFVRYPYSKLFVQQYVINLSKDYDEMITFNRSEEDKINYIAENLWK